MKNILKGFLGAIVFLVVVIVILAIVLPKPPDAVPAQSAATAPATDPNTAQQQTAGTPTAAPAAPTNQIPSDEQNLANIVSAAASNYNAASNDMQKGAIRAARKTAICNAFPNTEVTDWAGTIQTLSSTGAGNGVLTVAINDNLTVATANNEFSDSIDHTTIPANSPLFTAVSQMKVGDTVYFSGAFVTGTDDCFDETSLTPDGAMQSPNFSFHFTSVKEADATQ